MTDGAGTCKDPATSAQVASLRGHFSSRVHRGDSWGCYSGLCPTLISPSAKSYLPSFHRCSSKYTYCTEHTELSQSPPFREPTRWHRKGFDSYIICFFTLGRKHNQVIYANAIVLAEVHGWLWIYSIICMCILSVCIYIVWMSSIYMDNHFACCYEGIQLGERDLVDLEELTIDDGCLLFLSNQYSFLSLPLGKCLPHYSLHWILVGLLIMVRFPHSQIIGVAMWPKPGQSEDFILSVIGPRSRHIT